MAVAERRRHREKDKNQIERVKRSWPWLFHQNLCRCTSPPLPWATVWTAEHHNGSTVKQLRSTSSCLQFQTYRFVRAHKALHIRPCKDFSLAILAYWACISCHYPLHPGIGIINARFNVTNLWTPSISAQFIITYGYSVRTFRLEVKLRPKFRLTT